MRNNGAFSTTGSRFSGLRRALFLWIALRNELWFVGFMSLYAIWVTHLAGWAAETPVESEDESE